MINNIKGVIFDLDGTLIDSMGIWEKIDIDYLASLGFERPLNLKQEINHLSYHQVAAYFKKRFSIEDSIEKILETWHNLAYYEYKNNVKLKPGAKEFIINLKSKGIKIGLATSNSIPLIEACLKNNEIYELFDSITTTSEVTRGKNFPDVYLLAAEKLKVNPKNCLVFEDIYQAILGVKAAGMKVAAIEDSYVGLEEKIKLQEQSNYYITDYRNLII